MFNDKKTVCMCIAKANSGSSMPSFRIGEKSLDIVNEVKYLGHVIRSDFTDDKDIASQLRGLYCRVNMLVKRFSKCSDYIKCMLFKTYCCSMYCCALWSHYKIGTIRRLYVSYNNGIRISVCLPIRCSASLMCNIISPKGIIRKSCFGLYSGVAISPKNMVTDAFEWSVIQRGNIASHRLQTFT